MKYSYIAIPHYYNALNEYRLEIGYQLFEKYGWIAGERYCSTILPLDQWAPEDREALIDLYQSANPEYLRRRSPRLEIEIRSEGAVLISMAGWCASSFSTTMLSKPSPAEVVM
jgi:hypothetical protein